MSLSTLAPRVVRARDSQQVPTPSMAQVSGYTSYQARSQPARMLSSQARLAYSEVGPAPVTYAAPMTYAAPPSMTETVEVVRGPDGRSQVVEVFSQASPVRPVAALNSIARPIGQRIEAVEVIRRPDGVQEIIEVVKDDNEIFQLRLRIEEKDILITEYQRRNQELQEQTNELGRRLNDANGELTQLRSERAQLQTMIQENNEKIAQQQAEILDLIARNQELSELNDQQAQRITELDDLVVDLELKSSHQLTEINALRKCNQELEQLVAQQAAKIAELEKYIEQLKSNPKAEPAAPPKVEDNLNDDDKIDHRIKEFFRNHADFQVSITKERPGLYMFAKPISKKVNMKIVGEEVLARVGGGWEEVWVWLDTERTKHLEAEGILDADNSQLQKGRTSRTLGSKTGAKRNSR